MRVLAGDQAAYLVLALGCRSIVRCCLVISLNPSDRSHFFFFCSLLGRLVNAWTETPTKWYPLPLAVGALLLVAIQYRKKVKRAQKEVELNEDGLEVIKLKGPWHVRHILSSTIHTTHRTIETLTS